MIGRVCSFVLDVRCDVSKCRSQISMKISLLIFPRSAGQGQIGSRSKPPHSKLSSFWRWFKTASPNKWPGAHHVIIIFIIRMHLYQCK